MVEQCCCQPNVSSWIGNNVDEPPPPEVCHHQASNNESCMKIEGIFVYMQVVIATLVVGLAIMAGDSSP